MAKPLQDQLGLGLAQVQTANMDAQAFNQENASDPGRFQISGGVAPGSQGTIGNQTLSPITPTVNNTPSIAAAPQIQTSSVAPSTSNPIIINDKGGSGSNPIGSSPMGTKNEKVKSLTENQNPTTGGTELLGGQKSLSLLQIRETIKNQNPKLKPGDIMREARKQFEAQNNVINPATGLPEIPKTGISAVDIAQAKLREETLKNVNDTYKSYALAQGDYQKNAGYYTNFDGTNSTFNNVIKDIQNTLANTKQPSLSDQEIQIIAARNGVSADAVKNPLNIYNNLQMTEEGKQVLGVTNRENVINDLKTDNERKKIDAKTNLDRQTQQLNYQIEDAERQMKQTTDWMTASGAWSGAGKSSGYERGIQNVKDETGRLISRINDQLGYLNTDNEQYLSRLTEDFTNNMSRATNELNNDIKNLKHQTGLSLNGLEEKYGKGSKDLLKQLNSIYEQFGMSSLDINGKYLDQVSKIQGIAADNINLIDKYNTVSNTLKNKRYNELLAGNGALLQNMSLSTIAQEVKSGSMDIGKYADVRNLMISTVTNSLASKGVTVSQEDLNVITHLIDNGATPAQAIARLGGGNKADVSINPSSIADFSTQRRGRTNLQCGELTNDYWQQATGKPISNDPSINTYSGKLASLKKIGQSPIPKVGGIFVLNTGTKEGHIGIVQQVNPDGSVIALEANRNGSSTGGAPILGTYSAEQVKGMAFSEPPNDMISGSEQTVTPGTKGTRPDQNNNPGNVKAYGNDVLSIPGAVGVDEQNHIIFSNPTDGYKWMMKDIMGKMSGNNQWGLGPTSTLGEMGKIYAEDPNWASNVAQISGYTVDTPLSDIDVNKLAPAIARQEGFSGNIKAGAQSSTSGKTYTPTEKAVMEDYLKNPSDAKNIASLRNSNLTTQDVNAYKNPPSTVGGQVMGSLGIPFDYQSRLWNMIPAQLKNSEGEKATTEQNIKNLYNAGVSPEDAALTLLGFSVTEPKQKEEAKNIIAQARGIGEKLPETFYTNVSDYVNRGDMKGAQEYTNRIIEGSLKSALGDEFISTTSLNFSKSTLDRLNGFIEKNKDKIGPISGRFSDLEQQFMNDKDYQALKTLMAGSLADVRRTFGGTAVTATELGALRDFIGLDTKMPIENLKTALETNYDTMENKYSTQRGFYGVNNAPAEDTQKKTSQPSTDATVDSIYNDIINL